MPQAKKGRAPAHQNKFAFRHNPKSKKTASILASAIEHCCQRCYDKIEWRKKYRKYKPLTQPSKCNICEKRNITAAYHTVCDECSIKSTKAILLLKSWNSNPSIDTNVPLDQTTKITSISKMDDTNSDLTTDQNQPGLISRNKQCHNEDDTLDSQLDSASQNIIENENPGIYDDNNGNNSDDDGDEKVSHIIHRRVCTICFKAPALPASDDEGSDEENDTDGRRRNLRLREIKSIERQKQRAAIEKRRKKQEDRRLSSNNNNSDDGDDDDDEQDDINDSCSDNDESPSKNRDDGDNKLLRKLALKEDNDDDDDPFLKAVGGKLLIGEAYQQMILKKAEASSTTT